MPKKNYEVFNFNQITSRSNIQLQGKKKDDVNSLKNYFVTIHFYFFQIFVYLNIVTTYVSTQKV
jgi:sulfite reductase beta subunit-like hemoprotein